MPELELNDDGEPTLKFEPRPLPPRVNTPASVSPRPALPPPPPQPQPIDKRYAFLSGPNIDEFVLQLSAGQSTPRPSVKQQQRFAYFREQTLHDVSGDRGPLHTLPNPYQLTRFERITRDGQQMVTSTLKRYMTVSLAGGVTLWVDDAVVESYSVGEWREAHASFARVAGAPIMRQCRKRHTFRQWLRAVQAARRGRRTLALLRARREPQDALEAVSAPAVTAYSFSPAIEVVRRVSGWVRSQKLEPQQMGGGHSGLSRAGARSKGGGGGGAPGINITGDSISLGAVNGVSLAAAIAEQMRRANVALRSALDELRSGLHTPASKPLASTNADGCRFVLEKYSRRVYTLVAPQHFNRPANVRLLPHGNTSSLNPPPMRDLRGASLETLERWLFEGKPCDMRHTDRTTERAHLHSAARIVRLADMMLCSAVLQLPLEALRAFTQKLRGSAWKRLTGADNTPVLTLRLEKNPDTSIEAVRTPLLLSAPSAGRLTHQLVRACVDSLKLLKLPSEHHQFNALMRLHLREQGTPARPQATGGSGSRDESTKQITSARAGVETAESDAAMDDEDEDEAEAASATLDGADDPARRGGDAIAPAAVAGMAGLADATFARLDAMAERAWTEHLEAERAAEEHREKRSSRMQHAAEARAALPPMRGKMLVNPAPPPTSLRTFLERSYFDSPLPLVTKAIEELESALAAAIKKAERVALAHPQFLSALTDEGQAGLAQAPSTRTLDVGCIRIDGSALWPDEARECELEPFLAPMSLEALMSDFAKEPPPQPKAKVPKGKFGRFGSVGGQINVANVLAAMKGVVAAQAGAMAEEGAPGAS